MRARLETKASGRARSPAARRTSRPHGTRVSSFRRDAGLDETGSRRPSFGHAIGAPVAGSLIGKAAEFVGLAMLVTIVPRMLGPEDYGAFALALSIVLIASSSVGLGGPSLMARFVPTAPPEERPALARAMALRVAGGRYLATATIIVVGTALALTNPERFPPSDTAIVAIALVLDVTATLLLQVGLGLEMTWVWNLRWALQNAVLLAGTVLVVVTVGTTAAVAGVAIASGSACVLGLVVVGPVLVRAPAGAQIPPGAVRFGILQGISGVLVLVIHRGGVVAVALLGASGAQTGYAALAIGLALAATYTVWQVFASELPRLAGWAESDPEHAEDRARRLAWVILLALLPILLATTPLLDSLVPRVFGENFGTAEQSMGVALAAVPLAPLVALGTQLVSLRLRPGLRVLSSASGACAFAVAVATIPRWGATGGALAFLAGTATSAVVIAAALREAMGVRFVIVSVAGAAVVLALGLVS